MSRNRKSGRVTPKRPPADEATNRANGEAANKHSRGARRGAERVTCAVALGLAVTGATTGVAAASSGTTAVGTSSSTPPGTATPQLPTVGKDGTVHYPLRPAQAASAAGGAATISSTTTKTVVGTKNAAGACVFSDSQTITRQGETISEEEIAYNPITCTDTYQVVDSISSAKPTAAVATPSPAASSSIVYKNAYAKAQYTDPFGIDVAHIADNLGWGVNNPTDAYVYTPLNAIVSPHEFSADGWNAPVPYWSNGPYKNSNYSAASIEGGNTYTNTEFRAIIFAAFGPAGWAACGFDTSPTVLTFDELLIGHNNGTITYDSFDTKNGACNDLLQRTASSGPGSMS